MNRQTGPKADPPSDPDSMERHCPRLGGRVSLAYCRDSASETPPCDKIRDCWWERLEIDLFLSRHFPSERLAQIACQRPKSKIASLLELVARAQAK